LYDRFRNLHETILPLLLLVERLVLAVDLHLLDQVLTLQRRHMWSIITFQSRGEAAVMRICEVRRW
jgi:hypothetical protein